MRHKVEVAPEPEPAPSPFSALRRVSERFGECTPAATEDQLLALQRSLQWHDAPSDVSGFKLCVAQPDIPATLRALWQEAAEWHFSQDHYNAFGFNVFAPTEVVQATVDIFGGWTERDDWRSDILSRQPPPTAACPGWLCIASFSEFDYLFCCFDAASPSFGHVRHVVNNCCEDMPVLDDVNPVCQKLLEWDTAHHEEHEDPIETLSQLLWQICKGG